MCTGTAFNNRGFLTHASKGNKSKINEIKHRGGAGNDLETLNAVSLQII